MCSGHAHRLLRRRPPPRRLRGRLGGRRADAAPARDHREGDGHGGIFLHDPAHARPFTFFPLRVHDFGDGVHVVADVGGGAHVGKRVTAIDGVPLAQVLVSVRPLIAHDNASTVRLLVPEYLVCAEFLRGLGIVKGVRAARKPRFRSLVIDVRHNGGGDNTTYWPLLDLIESRPLRGKVVVLMGRMTFSAAGNFVAAVDYRTTARRAISSPRSTTGRRRVWSASRAAAHRTTGATATRSSCRSPG